MAEALKANGLDADLKGQMTVFVSSNSVFAKFSNNKANSTSADVKRDLQCHFIMQMLSANAIYNDMVLPSTSGDLVRFNLYDRVRFIITFYCINNKLEIMQSSLNNQSDCDCQWRRDDRSAITGYGQY